MSDDEQGFISKVSSSSERYLDLLTQLRKSADEIEESNPADLQFIVQASSDEVSREAHRQTKESVGSESEIPYGDPQKVIRQSEEIFMNIRDALVDKIEEMEAKEESSVKGSTTDSMLYIIDKKAGKTGKFTLIGGAESLIHNVGDKQGWNQTERQLVKKAHAIAAQKNNLQRHLLLDTVIIIPNDKQVI